MSELDYSFNKVSFHYEGGIAEAFPLIDPGIVPLGQRVLVQLRKPKAKTSGGIILPSETRETETWNTQVAVVRAVGPVAFRKIDDLTPWPEGAWVSEGEFVRVPKYGGDRFSVTDDDGIEVIFILFRDTDLIAKVTGDPLAVKAFI